MIAQEFVLTQGIKEIKLINDAQLAIIGLCTLGAKEEN